MNECIEVQQEDKCSPSSTRFRNNFLISGQRLRSCAAGRKAATHDSKEAAWLLDMKVSDTHFIGLCGCSLYKSVFLSGSQFTHLCYERVMLDQWFSKWSADR